MEAAQAPAAVARRRRILVALSALGLGPLQAAKTKRRLGLLFLERAEAWHFLEGELTPALAALGWSIGTDLALEWRFAANNPDKLPTLAMETVQSAVDALMTQGTLATRAARQATNRIPIVTGVGDPVGLGFAQSLAHPGGNITGVSYAWPETASKQVELLLQTFPRLSKITILSRPARADDRGALERAAQALHIATDVVTPRSLSELREALRALPSDGRNAAIVHALEPVLDMRAVALEAIEAHVPLMVGRQSGVEAGALMSYRLNWEHETGRRAAQLDKVLRGIPAGSIPFELPPRSQFAVNLRTARAIGVTIARAVLARADDVVE